MSHWQNDINHYDLFHEVEETPFFSKPFIIPIVALFIGSLLFASKGTKMNLGPVSFNGDKVYIMGALVIYFGAQSFMNVYMSWLMRKSVVAVAGQALKNRLGEDTVLTADLTGIPAAFALTALQQVISFGVFVVYSAVTWFTPYRYTPKPLTTNFDKFCVILFGLVFCMNIALNNFSLSLISIAVNLIIRSCLPLTTFLSQQVLASCDLYKKVPCRFLEIFLMCIGVTCAGLFTWAKMQALAQDAQQQDGTTEEATSQAMIFVLGVLVCVASLLSGSLNLALAGVLGTSVHLNPMDTVAYMAVPATLFLVPVIFFLKHPVPGAWPQYFGVTHATDYEIMKGVWALNQLTGSSTMVYGFLSGVFAFLYNVVQFTVVQTLSPSATAFGGNFNKAALIFLSLMTGLERQVGSPWNLVIWGAIIGNIAAFTWYGYLQMKAKMEPVHEELEDSDEEEDSSEEESEYA